MRGARLESIVIKQACVLPAHILFIPLMRSFCVITTFSLLACTGCDLKSLLTKQRGASDQTNSEMAASNPDRAAGLERLRVAEAMTFNDVSFLVRTGSTEKEVLIKRFSKR